MKFDRDRDGELEREEGDRVPAAEAARRRFFHSQPGKTMKEERVFQTVRTKKEQKQRRQSFHSASFATTPMEPMRAPVFSDSPAKKTSSSSFLTRTPGKKHRASDATLSFRTSTQKIPTKSLSTTTSTNTTSSLPETVVMTRPDVPQRRQHGRDDADDAFPQFQNESEKTRRLKKRALLDALQKERGEAEGDEETPNKNAPPAWITAQRDSRNIARGEKLVTNALMRATQLMQLAPMMVTPRHRTPANVQAILI